MKENDELNALAIEEQDEAAFRAVQAMLAHLHRRQDTTPLAQEIRSRFPSAQAMFRADRFVWEKMGLNSREALLFSLLMDISRCTQRFTYGKHPRIATLQEASGYLIANSYGLQVECFYLFCLDRRGCLKERILLQKGTDDGALFSLRRMLAEVVRAKPSSILLTHNHPGGTLRPSQEDIDCTLQAIRALGALSIPLLDHVIIAEKQAVSMRDNGFIPECLWIAQNPESRQLKCWLSAPEKAGKPLRRSRKKTDA